MIWRQENKNWNSKVNSTQLKAYLKVRLWTYLPHIEDHRNQHFWDFYAFYKYFWIQSKTWKMRSFVNLLAEICWTAGLPLLCCVSSKPYNTTPLRDTTKYMRNKLSNNVLMVWITWNSTFIINFWHFTHIWPDIWPSMASMVQQLFQII